MAAVPSGTQSVRRDEMAAANSEPSGGDGAAETPLRRSQRRNKYHLDISAILAHKNPDRRLSPSPPPPSKPLASNSRRSQPIAPPPPPLKAVKVEKVSACRRPIKRQCVEEVPVEVAALADAVSPTTQRNNRSAKAARVSPLDVKSPPAETLVAIEPDREEKPPLLSVEPTPTETEGAAQEEDGPAIGVELPHALQPAAEMVTVKLEEREVDKPVETRPSLEVSAALKVEIFEAEAMETDEAAAINPPTISSIDSSTDSSATGDKTTDMEEEQSNPAPASKPATASIIMIHPVAPISSTEIGKRSRKPPPRHRDFQLTSTNSEDERDEEIFKSAKIEYTNADGSKVWAKNRGSDSNLLV